MSEAQGTAPGIGARIAWDDTILPFQLDATGSPGAEGIRGRVARLDGVLDRVLAQHAYPPAVEALVAEAALLAALIGPTIKLRWKLSIQVRGDGPARIVAADYYAPEAEGAPARLRAWASFDDARLDPAGPAFPQIGRGYFALLIDQGEGTTPYQGITPIAGGSLASCAETYFAQSEQIPTRFALSFGRSRLAAALAGASGGAFAGAEEAWRAGGVMIQHMPSAGMGVAAEAASGGGQEGGSGEGGLLAHADLLDGEEGENWARANILLNTVEPLELVGPQVQPTDLLLRLFHEERPRVFDSLPLSFGCSCSADRVRQSLSIYSAKDIRSMTTPEGIVTADCQFCGAHYEFAPETLGFEAEALEARGSAAGGLEAEGGQKRGGRQAGARR